jgi:ribosomal protein S18 acetylase RimI-like enzyme
MDKTEVTIEPAVPADAAALAEINRDCMGYDYPMAQTAMQLQAVLADSQQRVFVARRNGVVVGYLHAESYLLLYAPPLKNILGLAVRPDQRGQNIATRLMDAARQWAAHDGAAGLRLVSSAARTGAHAFYRAYGFSVGREQYNFKLMF